MALADSDIITRFGADIGPLKKGAKEASKTLGSVSKSARKTANQMGKMAGVATLAGAALGVTLVKGSLNAIDSQAKLAKQLGTTSASIATLDRAAEMSGITLKNIESGAKNLEVAMGEAAQGTGIAKDALEQMGIAAKDLEGLTLDEKILKVNAAIKKNIPATEQAAAAADLFGKKAGFAISQLSPETIAAAKKEVVGFGVALSDFDSAKIEAANDAMGTIGLAVKGVSNQFTVALAPILEDLANSFKNAAIESGGFRDEAVTAVDSIASAVGFLGNSLKSIEITIASAKLAFEGLSVVTNIFVTTLVENVDFGAQYFMATINNMIDAANNIPGVNLDKLVVGKSALAESMRATLDAAKEELALSATKLNNLVLQPLPSKQVELYLESIREKNSLIEGAELESLSAQERAREESNAKLLAKQKTFGQQWESLNSSFKKEDKKGTQQFFSDIATLTSSGNKRLFEIGKIAARANVIIDTNESAMKAYKWAAGWGGPVAGSVAAGAAIAAGAVRLSAINSTSFGGGGGGAASAGSAGGAPATQSAAAAPAAQESNRTIRIEGIDPNKSFSGGQVQQLAEQLVEFQNDGGTLVI